MNSFLLYPTILLTNCSLHPLKSMLNTVPKPDSVSNRNEIQETILIFEYWMRTLLPNRNASCRDLVQLIQQYFPITSFEWDENRTNKELILSNGGKTFNVGNGYLKDRALCSVNMLTAEFHSSAVWELMIVRKLDHSMEPSMFGAISTECVYFLNVLGYHFRFHQKYTHCLLIITELIY